MNARGRSQSKQVIVADAIKIDLQPMAIDMCKIEEVYVFVLREVLTWTSYCCSMTMGCRCLL